MASQVGLRIKEIIQELDEIGVQGDDRQTVLAELLRREWTPSEASHDPHSEQATIQTYATDDYVLAAEMLKISPDLLRGAFTITEEQVSLEIPSNLLPRQKNHAALEVAVVLAAVNGALGRETDSAQVRETLEQYSRFDPGNFMSQLKKLGADYLTIKGKPGSSKMLLVARRQGREFAAELLQRWVGDS